MTFSTILFRSLSKSLRGPTTKFTLSKQTVRCISSFYPPSHDSFSPKKLLAPPNIIPKMEKQLTTTPMKLAADHKSHDHVKIWKVERILSVALIPLVPAALIAPNPILDTLVALSVVMHTHWGLEAIVVDYVRPILFGSMAPKIGMGLLYVFSTITLLGCLNLIYNDIGLANSFLELWKL